jgi:uncharacterized protein
MTYLPDVNFWMALAVVNHAQNAAARKWIDKNLEGEFAFCRITQKGFIRLLTNPAVMKEDALSPQEAWIKYDAWEAALEARFAPEPPGFQKAWRNATTGKYTGKDFWTDAYLASFAAASGFIVITFDQRFPRNSGAVVRAPL